MSGSIKQALDMVKQLQEVAKGGLNPKMAQSVGAGNLAGALKDIAAKFKQQMSAKEKKRVEELEAQANEELSNLANGNK